jgi:hypothetical protein
MENLQVFKAMREVRKPYTENQTVLVEVEYTLSKVLSKGAFFQDGLLGGLRYFKADVIESMFGISFFELCDAPRYKVSIQEGFTGYIVNFSKGNQTFSLEEMEDKSRAEFFVEQLDVFLNH